MKRQGFAFLLTGVALLLASCGGAKSSSLDQESVLSASSGSSLPETAASSSSSPSKASSSSKSDGTKTIRGTFLDDWALSDDPSFFVWGWDEGTAPGSYYAGEAVDGRLEASVPSAIDSLIVLRYKPAGILPEAGQDTWVDGTWNQTETISLTGTSYEIRFIPGY